MFQDKMVTAILLAGGSGTRFGGGLNKVYREAGGKPILQYSLEVLDAHPLVDELVLVVKPEEREMAEEWNGRKPVIYTAGGATRQESVYHGLLASHGQLVLIHDSARPLIRPLYITACLEAMEEWPGVSIAVPSKDTVKLTDDRGQVMKTTRRANTWLIQTPQCFHRDILLAAHEAHRDNPEITDDCMLLEAAGQPVKLLEGDYTNIKVTTAEDLELVIRFLEKADETTC